MLVLLVDHLASVLLLSIVLGWKVLRASEEVRQQAAAARGCHVALFPKASPRLEVGCQSSSSRFVFVAWKPRCGWERREREKEKEKEEREVSRCLPVHASCSSCPIFLRTLSGRTVAMDVADCTTHELLQHIEKVTRVPQQHWYCRVNGSPLPDGNANHWAAERLHGRHVRSVEGRRPGRMVLPSVPTERMLASAHTLFQVRLQEGRTNIWRAQRESPATGLLGAWSPETCQCKAQSTCHFGGVGFHVAPP